MTIKVLIADDHQVVREGLRSMISQREGMEVVAEAKNGVEAVKLCRKLTPDLVIMDISMPDLNGMEATRAIKEEQPGVKILALSMHSQKQFVESILEAGASGYLLKSCVSDEINAAVQKVMSGEVYICEKITGVIIDSYLNRIRTKEGGKEAGKEGREGSAEVLSSRERQVLQLLAEGRQTKEIASELFISPRTVEMYRGKIMQKLNLSSVAELTKFAIREGLTTLD